MKRTGYRIVLNIKTQRGPSVSVTVKSAYSLSSSFSLFCSQRRRRIHTRQALPVPSGDSLQSPILSLSSGIPRLHLSLSLFSNQNIMFFKVPDSNHHNHNIITITNLNNYNYNNKQLNNNLFY